uniref:Uncharacterized protein n=1 Tax=Pristionchus pacificus TaxID=54126 RepID=A0A2A6C5J2_PRIPA|eukprot:PDM73482.1 hypothetical protein PRIPAC_40838 [Pristionchus pacificus]
MRPTNRVGDYAKLQKLYLRSNAPTKKRIAWENTGAQQRVRLEKRVKREQLRRGDERKNEE